MSEDLCVCGHTGSIHYAIETWQSCCGGNNNKCICDCLDYDGSKTSCERLYKRVARVEAEIERLREKAHAVVERLWQWNQDDVISASTAREIERLLHTEVEG